MNPIIEWEQQGSVGYIWLNRPDLHNAFNADLIAGLSELFASLHNRQDIRVVVLGGRGKSFSAGADLNWMKQAGAASESENQEDARRLANMLDQLNTLPQVTIARVQGAALGGGMGLASACDICLAGEAAVFATSEVRLGLAPSTISPYVIAAIGERQASRYFLTAERISAHQAQRIGLVHEVFADNMLDEGLSTIIAHILKGAPQAQAASKALIRMVSHQTVDDALKVKTSQHIAALRASDEAKEGLDAFLNKRAAKWCE